MQNEPMGHMNPSDVNNSIQRGVTFHPSGSCVSVTNPVTDIYGRLLAHPCAESRLFFIPLY